MNIKEFILVNDEKALIARDGDGREFKGFGDDEDAVLAEYDRRGGLIKDQDGNAIATGSFYDFAKKAPRKEPQIEFKAERVVRPGTTIEPLDDEVKKSKKGKKK